LDCGLLMLVGPAMPMHLLNGSALYEPPDLISTTIF
jgi:hypothetical protein